MGILVAMRYPTSLFAKAADHTYVMCSTGAKAWGCWGGKTGGTFLRQGQGSTKQADAIAEPNERAHIKCYLINGVCHQAANRILLPAGITVMGARGYGVSEALFGPYGRPLGPFGTCLSPFDQHTGVTGDLPECLGAGPRMMRKAGRATIQSDDERRREQKYIRETLKLYGHARPAMRMRKAVAGPELEGFHAELFMLKARYNLRSRLDRALAGKLRNLRISTERSRMKIEDWFSHQEMKPREFVEAFNRETIVFQEAAAGVLKADQYKALFGLNRGETVILADPRIVKKVYGDK